MIKTPDIERPSADLIDAFDDISSATASGELYRLGLRNPHLQGLTAHMPGEKVVGPALTLQFMPKREDLYDVDEYADPEKQLHRHALYHTRPGDIVVVDARADLSSGVFGEMMPTSGGDLRDLWEPWRLPTGILSSLVMNTPGGKRG